MSPEKDQDIRQRLRAAVAHLDHVLPGQAPLLNFVHHNTLHGYQHLPFPQALEAAEKLTGIHGYLPEQQFRHYYAQGRIDENDLASVFERQFGEENEPLKINGKSIGRREVYRIALLYGVEPITPEQFNWQLEETNALHRFQADVPQNLRQGLLQAAATANESEAIHDIWNACLEVFGLDHHRLHPEELTELALNQAQSILAEFDADTDDLLACAVHPGVHQRMREESHGQQADLLAELGKGITLRGLLLSLTGKDLLDEVRPILIRFCASYLDEGLAAWHSPDRTEGLYSAWKRCAAFDFSLTEDERAELAELPEQSVDAVIMILERLGIPKPRWEDYLERLALELPGWSGIINWRVHHPDYPANRKNPASLMDYLALRLFLDALWIERICRENWGLPGRLGALKDYFERHSSEWLARRMLFSGELPEYLANIAQKLIGLSRTERKHHESWRALADMIFTWKRSPAAERFESHTLYRSSWRLFRLAQHLGLTGQDLSGLKPSQAERLLQHLDELTPTEKGHLWLQAFEHHYREDLFTALAQNHGRGHWVQRETRPQAQLIFCMDDREEGIRRHLEELNPQLETLGAAGFFGVAMNWRGLDDSEVSPLCPVVVTPTHEVREQASQEEAKEKHARRLRLKTLFRRILHQEIRRNLLSSNLLIGLIAPGVLGALVGKIFFPRLWDGLKRKLTIAFDPPLSTKLNLTAPADSPPATPQQPRLGFTDTEQADRVASFLRNVGLSSGFAPLVVLSGHGSISQNNPHLAAYDCGACSGRHGGPNARAFAAMANRPQVRTQLAERGIAIPEDTWFIGTEHNTGNEEILWFDLDALPSNLLPALAKLRADLDQAVLLSAHERCRRFASAPRNPSLRQALNHVRSRCADFSQARPELGHATHAAALIGRRSVSRGTFLDRRVFLISYDPSQDPEGRILEGILLAAGPVGAGINLEYYFSTVNNEHYGCGSKVPHNITGLFAVMNGTSSDLRTGLPRQMVEIHEAMRLSLVCEAREEVLAAIYQRQPPLRELIGNGWLLLSAIHPETGAISCFDPLRGFIPWSASKNELPWVERSADWYAGHRDPRPPALIANPDAREARHAA